VLVRTGLCFPHRPVYDEPSRLPLTPI